MTSWQVQREGEGIHIQYQCLVLSLKSINFNVIKNKGTDIALKEECIETVSNQMSLDLYSIALCRTTIQRLQSTLDNEIKNTSSSFFKQRVAGLLTLEIIIF